MTNEQQETFLPASAPWLARYFSDALALIGELEEASNLGDFVPACIGNQELADLIKRYSEFCCAMPSPYDDKRNPPPLELVVLDQALSLLQDFLEMEKYRRKSDPVYAEDCKAANETKRYRDANDGAWPPSAIGGEANG